MKPFNLVSILLACSLLFASCRKETKSDIHQDDIPVEVINNIKALGFSTNEVKKWNDGYLVEGDIYLTDENLKEGISSPLLNIAQTEQYRTNNLVSVSGSRTINVTVNTNTLSAVYVSATDIAIQRYNEQGLRINFVRYAYGSAPSGAVTLSGFYQGPNADGSIVLGSAGFPSSGNPFTSISMNTHPLAYGSNPDVNFLASVIQHEIGHCIGFRHTDYANRAFSCPWQTSGTNEGDAGIGAVFIPGTPSTPDADSWMLACSNGGNRTFNYNDIVALNYLYGNPSTIFEGNIVRNDDTGEIFVFMEGKLRHIQDYNTYVAIFTVPSSIIKHYNTAGLVNIPRGNVIPPGSNLLRNAADGRIYFAEGNNIVKRWIISGVVYDRYHFNWSGYVNATQAMLDAYPTGPDLK